MLRVALTGGIGSGKTTVCQLFHELGAPVVDADEISRAITRPGQSGYRAIVEQFGWEILDEDGALNRRLLRERVFTDTDQRRRLEACLHPLIFAEIWTALDALEPDCAYAITSIPLLVETGAAARFDRVLVVDCAPETQIARVRRRDHLDETTVRCILAAQSSRAERLAIAHDVLANVGEQVDLKQKVAKLDAAYRRLAIDS